MVDLPLNSYSYASNGSLPREPRRDGAVGRDRREAGACRALRAALVTVRRLGDRLAPGSVVWVAAVLAWTPALLLIAGWAWSEWGVLALLFLSYLGWLELQERPSAGAAALVTARSPERRRSSTPRCPGSWCSLRSLRVRIARRGLGRGRAAGRGLAPLLGGGGDRDGAARRVLLPAQLVVVRLAGGSVPAFGRAGDRAAIARRARSRAGRSCSSATTSFTAASSTMRSACLLPICALVAPFGALRYRAARDLCWIGSFLCRSSSRWRRRRG